MSKVSPIPVALSLDGLGDEAREVFSLAARNGYSAVSLPTNHPQLRPEDLGDTARRHLQHVLGWQGLSIAAVRIAAPRGGLADSATTERTIDRARAGMNMAHALGVRTVALNAGTMPTEAGCENLLRQALEFLALEADKAGIHLAISADNSIKLAEMISKIGYAGAKANLEPARIIGAGEDPIVSAEKMAGKIAQLSCVDAIRAGRQVRVVEMDQGQVDWPSLLAALREQDFQGPMVVDVRDLMNAPQAAQHAAEYLRNILAVNK